MSRVWPEIVHLLLTGKGKCVLVWLCRSLLFQYLKLDFRMHGMESQMLFRIFASIRSVLPVILIQSVRFVQLRQSWKLEGMMVFQSIFADIPKSIIGCCWTLRRDGIVNFRVIEKYMVLFKCLFICKAYIIYKYVEVVSII